LAITLCGLKRQTIDQISALMSAEKSVALPWSVSRESFLATIVSEKASQRMLRRSTGTSAFHTRKPNRGYEKRKVGRHLTASIAKASGRSRLRKAEMVDPVASIRESRLPLNCRKLCAGEK
jgi:hypothetical protein